MLLLLLFLLHISNHPTQRCLCYRCHYRQMNAAACYGTPMRVAMRPPMHRCRCFLCCCHAVDDHRPVLARFLSGFPSVNRSSCRCCCPCSMWLGPLSANVEKMLLDTYLVLDRVNACVYLQFDATANAVHKRTTCIGNNRCWRRQRWRWHRWRYRRLSRWQRRRHRRIVHHWRWRRRRWCRRRARWHWG